MVNLDVNLLIDTLCLLAACFALIMLIARSAITSALALLAVLLCTGGIYGLLNEHFIAAIQLVVYAGAIMVLFIFSIMLLNFSEIRHSNKRSIIITIVAVVAAMTSFAGLGIALYHYYQDPIKNQGPYTSEKIAEWGGNTKVLAQELFTSHHILFEVVSIALLISLVAAVVLAKRKIKS